MNAILSMVQCEFDKSALHKNYNSCSLAFQFYLNNLDQDSYEKDMTKTLSNAIIFADDLLMNDFTFEHALTHLLLFLL